MSDEQADLALWRSKLTVQDNVVIKHDQKDNVVGRHSLSEIRDVNVIEKFDPMGFTFLIAGAVLACVCKLYIPSVLWSWIATFVFVGVCLFAMFDFSNSTTEVSFISSRPP